MDLRFVGLNDMSVLRGIDAISPHLNFKRVKVNEGGKDVIVRQGDSLTVRIKQEHAEIEYSKKSELYRGLSLLMKNWGQEIEISQKPCFESCGMMMDCSRNAVTTVDAVKTLLCQLALMGHNLFMLYTEDTYTISGQEYFGYLRGRYSVDELREMDDWADMLGIEMIPCIQTLGHLNRVLHWPQMEEYKDTDEVLLVGEDATYRLIEDMLVSISACFRSKRVHIGMDEAFNLGLGKYLGKNGYRTQSELMAIHLERVHQILQKHGLHGMMWSDMHFYAAKPGSGLYHPDCEFSKEMLDGAPDDIDLVYWDYYRETENEYGRIIKLHKEFRAETIFAGGLWCWTGPAVDYRKTIAATIPALNQCKKHGIQQVIATAWNDDGAETDYQTVLLGLQIYAEYNYTGAYDKDETAAMFNICVGSDAEAFLDITMFNELPNMDIVKPGFGSTGTASPCKMLLYEDPLIPIFEEDLKGIADSGYYAALKEKFSSYRNTNAKFFCLFDYYCKLADVLEAKCIWRNRAALYVREHNRKEAGELALYGSKIIEKYKFLLKAWRVLWFSTHKPYGFEIIELRLGGQIARFESASERLLNFSNGTIADIPELSEKKLPMIKDANGRMTRTPLWAEIISGCKYGW